MRVLLLGAGGMLGRDLLRTARPCVELVPRTHADLDVTDFSALQRAVEDVRPKVIINAAAYTAVDRAENEREVAWRVNAEAVGTLGRLAAERHIRVVHFSTDYVFDGAATEPYSEDAPTNPINVYGAGKLAGEDALRASGADFLLLRTQWLFGVHGRSFPKTMWERARHGLATPVVNDQVGCPTYTVDLASAVWRLVNLGHRGVLHVASAGRATWFDVAKLIFQALGVGGLVRPCATAEYPTPARRPRYSVLDTSRATDLVGPLPQWRDAVRRFLDNLGPCG